MAIKENDLVMPALVGGALAGILSSIPFFHCLCCLWVLAGGVLATYLLSDRASKQSTSYQVGDGLLTGALSGVFGAVISLIIRIPLAGYFLNWNKRFLESLARFADEMPPGWEKWTEIGQQGWNPFTFFLSLLLTSIIFALLGALGGLIGFSLFKPSKGAKNETQTPQNPGDSQPGL
ncbi:MAG: hypothetical protein QHH43_00235 [Candidatus Saccharicenans sp.]|jgi:hypothetical protein|nr:hypothetical protein [Candidatus Saccharicenans sp.]MDH7574170.1 hypothetical protein [Candidatus Saccharicenans sp.]